MAEIALRTTEFLNNDPRKAYIAYRPVGSVVVAMSAARIRRKWLEILCDLMAPSKRDSYVTLPGFNTMKEMWSHELLGKWVEFYRDQRNKFNEVADAKFWTEVIEPIGLLPDLPKDPLGLRPVYETWLWSDHERKTLFIITNDDASTATVESWNGRDALDEDGDAMSYHEEQVLRYHIEMSDGSPAIASAMVPEMVADKALYAILPKRMVKYETDIPDLSEGSKGDIADPDVIVHPRFDKPVLSTLVKRPTLLDITTGVSIK